MPDSVSGDALALPAVNNTQVTKVRLLVTSQAMRTSPFSGACGEAG